MKQCFGNALS